MQNTKLQGKLRFRTLYYYRKGSVAKPYNRDAFSGFLIQQVHTKIQHTCKGYPNDIWYHKVCGFWLDFIEFNCRCNNQYPQNNDPYKRKQILPECKEKTAPTKVEK